VYIPSGYTPGVRTVGGNITRLREARGWSQVDLADRLHMRQASASKLEKAKNPKVKTLLKVANLFGCSVDELLRDVDEVYTSRQTAPSTPVDPALTEWMNLGRRVLQATETRRGIIRHTILALLEMSPAYGPSSKKKPDVDLGDGGELVEQPPDEPLRSRRKRRVNSRDR